MDMKLSPRWLLALMSAMNLLIYIDRGAIGSNGVNGNVAADGHPGTGIQGHFGINNAQDGILPGAFMVGLLVSSPLFAESSKRFNAFRLIAVGLTVWAVACALCGLAPTFWLLVVFRMFVGVGEASFVALASPFIDDYAPAASKTQWLAIFYLCIPTGYALGYIFGGLVAVPLGWRAPFLLEAAAMIPFILYCSFAPPIDIRGTKGEKADHLDTDVDDTSLLKEKVAGPIAALGEDLLTLGKHPVYILTVLGSTLYVGVIGAYSFLGPKAGKAIFDIPGETADLVFGGVTVLTGILGTLLGGIALDRMGSGVKNALIICAVCMAAGCVAVIISFAIAKTLVLFVILFGVGELALFATQAPQNAIVLWSVPVSLRPFAMSMSIVITHCLGDVPSPSIIGAIQDRLHNWRESMSIATAFLALSAGFYVVAKILSHSQPDYRQREPESSDPASAENGNQPLLQNDTAQL